MAQKKVTELLKKKEIKYTGKLKYLLTNDYLFKVFLQRNEKALRGLLSALLNIKLEDIKDVRITNPILEGETIDDKTMILDIQLILNSEKIINIEMQVQNLGDWPERSLGYLCRTFDQLNHGDDYIDVKETIHIGILDFTPKDFPEQLYSDYYVMEKKNHHVYSDKFNIRMLQLNQLGNPEDEKQLPEIYHWAQLFKATTWEEVVMVAEKNETIKECIVTLKQLTDDEKEQMRIEARERYQSELSAATKYGKRLGAEKEQARTKAAEKKAEEAEKKTETAENRANTAEAENRKLREQIALLQEQVK